MNDTPPSPDPQRAPSGGAPEPAPVWKQPRFSQSLPPDPTPDPGWTASLPGQQQWPTRAASPSGVTPARSSSNRKNGNLVAAVTILCVVLGLPVLTSLGSNSAGNLNGSDSTWVVSATDLRPDVDDPHFLRSLDGSVDGASAVRFDDSVVVLSSGANDADLKLSGLDMDANGEETWSTELDDGLCAQQPLDGEVVCVRKNAEADNAKKPWTVESIDPSGGDVSASVDLAVRPEFIAVYNQYVLLLSQSESSGDPVWTVLDSTLDPSSTENLAQRQWGSRLLASSRDNVRARALPTGSVLGNIRLRELTNGIAVEVGNATMVVGNEGAIEALLPCDQVVDDGERLWCGSGGAVTQYSYSFKPGIQVSSNVRLANTLPGAPGGAPVFLNAQGQVVSVDPASGMVTSTIAKTTTANDAGTTVWPTASQVNGGSVVADGTQRVFVTEDGKVRWRMESEGRSAVTELSDRIVIPGGSLTIVDSESGKQLSTDGPSAWGAMDDNHAGVLTFGGEQLSRQELP